MADDKKKDGRLVAVTRTNVGGTVYQKGEFVDTSGLEKDHFDYLIDSGVLWTETEWVAKYGSKPVEHKSSYPAPQRPTTSAEMAAKAQETNPALKREGAASSEEQKPAAKPAAESKPSSSPKTK